MIVRNKKNGTNILAFGSEKVIIKAGEVVNIPALTNLNQVINKADFTSRGWFEIIEEEDVAIDIVTESNLEKAKKEMKEYTSKKKEE